MENRQSEINVESRREIVWKLPSCSSEEKI